MPRSRDGRESSHESITSASSVRASRSYAYKLTPQCGPYQTHAIITPPAITGGMHQVTPAQHQYSTTLQNYDNPHAKHPFPDTKSVSAYILLVILPAVPETPKVPGVPSHRETPWISILGHRALPGGPVKYCIVLIDFFPADQVESQQGLKRPVRNSFTSIHTPLCADI